MNNPKLTIVSISYNQERFIQKAIDSFLMQKTNFSFEVIIADDCSTDSTAKIIADYAKKYPDIIKPILRNKNLGIESNYIDVLSRINSQYVIINEADDYFMDDKKLQKQVDFLDANPDYSICFHPVCIKWENDSRPDTIFPTKKMLDKYTLDLSGLLKINFIQTNSCMYRWHFKSGEDFRSNFPKNILPCDYFLHLLHAKVGKIAFLSKVMSVYRRWNGGIWFESGESDSWFIKCGVKHLRFYKEVDKSFKYDSYVKMKDLSKNILSIFLKNHLFRELEDFQQEFPNLYEDYINEEINQKALKVKKKATKLYFKWFKF